MAIGITIIIMVVVDMIKTILANEVAETEAETHQVEVEMQQKHSNN